MTKSGENTRRALLEAANRIVRRHGAQHLTLELTAREAGVSKGALLYHFPEKEALIKGMIADYLEHFSAQLNAAAQKDGGQAAGRWTRSYLRTTCDDDGKAPRMNSGLLAAAAIDPSLLIPLQKGFADWVDQLTQDGIDPVTAMIIRLAVDGLWMIELFDLAAPDPAMRSKILAALEDMLARAGKASKSEKK